MLWIQGTFGVPRICPHNPTSPRAGGYSHNVSATPQQRYLFMLDQRILNATATLSFCSQTTCMQRYFLCLNSVSATPQQCYLFTPKLCTCNVTFLHFNNVSAMPQKHCLYTLTCLQRCFGITGSFCGVVSS